ncbi:ABC-type antimicrobial peptide transport system permease subunit [Methanohalophilus levihalophilus]|uniref:hypothetical protein n=1 Tax=Methanohalophilus levihalophilus TaxID=1431282 RepID=UPI001AE14FC5|nr:hypothetical protein [Methanohalophilus levihalophilus]MBP2030811.1 ABC-type antimicrobial peptide transport system permease subunit [Methanohalophilus levihalophilus]
MTQQLKSLAFSLAAAIVAAIVMLLLGILGNFGIYTGAFEMMQQWHMFFSLTPTGIIAGMIEAAIISFIFAYLFGVLYNKFA